MSRTSILTSFLLFSASLLIAQTAAPIVGLIKSFGDQGNNSIQGMATAAGNLYIVGNTVTDVPLLNSMQTKPKGAQAMFVAKFDLTGTKLIYSTYFGGSTDIASAIAVDRDGAAYIAGTTPPPNGTDAVIHAWVRKINPAGSAVVYETTIQGQTSANAVAVDTQGNAYLAGVSVGNFPAVHAIQSVAPIKPIFVSNDAGATWTAITTLPAYAVNSLAVDPSQGSILYAATSSGVFKSTDAGATWNRILPDAKSASQISLDPTSHSTIYILYIDSASSTHVAKSSDGGLTWQDLTAAVPQPKLSPFVHLFGALAIDPSNPSIIWLSDVPIRGSAIYRSTDGGAHWTDVYDFPPFGAGDTLGGGDPDVLVDPTKPSRVYACCVERDGGSVRPGVFRTDDAGQTWIEGGEGPTAGEGIWAPRIDSSGVLYASWSGGLVRSSDAANSWTTVPLPAGAPSVGFSSGSLAVGLSGALWLVNGNGTLFRSSDSGATWSSTTGPWSPGARILYASGPTIYVGSPSIASVQHAFAAKLDTNGSIEWATLLAGSSLDYPSAIAVDGSGNAYIAGTTLSNDYPLANAYQKTKAPGYDAFLSKISSDGTRLIYSTYLGGNQDESIDAVTVDSAGNAFLAGSTSSLDFPTINAIQSSPANGTTSTFVAQLDPSGQKLPFATYLTGSSYSGGDFATAIALDQDGSIWVAGQAGTISFPLVNPVQTTLGPNGAGYIARLAPAAKGFALNFSTYLGDANSITGIARGPGVMWVGGATSSSDFMASALPVSDYLVRLDLTPSTTAPGVPLIRSMHNSASYRPQTGIAPGQLLTLFGAELAPGAEGAQSFPLPTSLQGVRVLIGGTPVSLLYVSPGQINFQAPYDLPQSGATIVVQRGAQTSAPFPVGTAALAVGIFTSSDGYASPVVVHASDYTLVTPQNPAHPGEYVAVFCTGLGPTNPPAQAGQAASAASIVKANAYVVLDQAVIRVVPYAGLAPGWSGLYQVNFQVPVDETSGAKLLYIENSNLVLVYVD